MRISIALSVLILAIGATMGWQDHQRLVRVRESHDKLVAEALESGIALDPTNLESGVRFTKHEREDKEAIARLAASEFIAFAKEMEAKEKKGGMKDEVMQKKILAVMDRMMSLDSSQLKILIAEIKATSELNDEMRRGLVGFSIMSLADKHPQAALALFTESSDLFENDGMGKHVISSSLSKWAKDDPEGALDWVRKNGAKFPELVDDDAKQGVISGVASNDPKLAFQLIGELDFKNTDGAIRKIVGEANTPSERTATLAALEEHLATITDAKVRKDLANTATSQLAQGAAKDGFETGSKWITDAGFTPEQLERITGGGLAYSIKGEDTGKWIEWMGQTLPEGKASQGIGEMVRNWTQNDYQAAGKWLTTQPDGPTKEASVRSYAETVSKYDPDTAAQWAMTLPAGKDRTATLSTIYHNWPRNDDASKEAAEAFARQHGIR